MTFRPDKMLVTGEIQLTLTNGHTVPAKIVMTETGEVRLIFTDAEMVAAWLRKTLDGTLIGLRLQTLGTVAFDAPSTTPEQFLQAAKEALVKTGYFKPEEVGDDIAPRILEMWFNKEDPHD